MSTFFKIDAKILTIAVVYLMCVYTVIFCFSSSAIAGDDVKVIIPEFDVTRTNISQDDINASIDQGNGIMGSIIGGVVVGLAALATAVTAGAAAPVLFAAVGVGVGAVTGYVTGTTVSMGARQANVELPWNDFCFALRGFFGSVVDLFLFLTGFLSFGIITDTGMDMPAEFSWLLFLMTFPLWIYFLIIIAGFAVEAWRSIKAW